MIRRFFSERKRKNFEKTYGTPSYELKVEVVTDSGSVDEYIAARSYAHRLVRGPLILTSKGHVLTTSKVSADIGLYRLTLLPQVDALRELEVALEKGDDSQKPIVLSAKDDSIPQRLELFSQAGTLRARRVGRPILHAVSSG